MSILVYSNWIQTVIQYLRHTFVYSQHVYVTMTKDENYLSLEERIEVFFSFFESLLLFFDRLLFARLLCLWCLGFSSDSLSDISEEDIWGDESWELRDESAEWEVLFLLPSRTEEGKNDSVPVTLENMQIIKAPSSQGESWCLRSKAGQQFNYCLKRSTPSKVHCSKIMSITKLVKQDV